MRVLLCGKYLGRFKILAKSWYTVVHIAISSLKTELFGAIVAMSQKKDCFNVFEIIYKHEKGKHQVHYIFIITCQNHYQNIQDDQ